MTEIKYEEVSQEDVENEMDIMCEPNVVKCYKVICEYHNGEGKVASREFCGYIVVYGNGIVSQINEEGCCNVADINLAALLPLIRDLIKL